MRPRRRQPYAAALLLPSAAMAALPNVDFDRMGKVGLAGAFAGLDLVDNTTSVTFDPSSASLLSRSSEFELGAVVQCATSPRGSPARSSSATRRGTSGS